jgi:hypothetical protein
VVGLNTESNVTTVAGPLQMHNVSFSMMALILELLHGL